MGYRSDGLWVIKGPANHIIAAWVKCRLTLSPPTGEAENLWDLFTTYRHGDTGYIRLSYEGWKWYDSYPDIQFLELVWNALAEYADANDIAKPGEVCAQVISGKRIRIGEDDKDIEEDSFGFDSPDIYVSRSIQDDEHPSGEPLTPTLTP